MAAPITSSDDWADGICCPDTFSVGWVLFQEATICSPQATSWALLEYQMVMGPWAVVFEVAPLPPQAAIPRVRARAPATILRDVIVVPSSDHGRSSSRRSGTHAKPGGQ